MRPFAPVENNNFPLYGRTENTISSRERHNVFTTPSGNISNTALCALASVAVIRRVWARGVVEDTGSSGSMTWISCGSAAFTVTVTVACGFELVPDVAGVAAGASGGSPLIAEA